MIVVNIDKAKAIGHDIRRAKREEEFAPLDAVIMKQIPGKDAQAAEAQRQAIRDKYAEIQVHIDSAQTPEDIKAALGMD
jgi:cephalosporin hydroxylase